MRRRLDVELVRRGLVTSRAQAAALIRDGGVLVGGVPATTPARQVDAGEAVALAPGRSRFVSRGGDKLDAALDRFGVDVVDRRCLDAGASTGGFTDCLLQRGARSVVAVDVGRGQLAWSLRQDPRVRVLERTNIRDLEPEVAGGRFDLAVADLSFISLRTVAPALVRLVQRDAPLVLLVKPQFEAGRSRLGKGGVVRDPAVRHAVLHEVVAGLAHAGLGVTDLMESPLRGADGNVEFLALASVGAPRMAPHAIDAVAGGTP